VLDRFARIFTLGQNAVDRPRANNSIEFGAAFTRALMDDRYSRLRTIDGLRNVGAPGVVFNQVNGGARFSHGLGYRTRVKGVEKLIRLRDATRAARCDRRSVGRGVVVN